LPQPWDKELATEVALTCGVYTKNILKKNRKGLGTKSSQQMLRLPVVYVYKKLLK
jgi:hypothetical protein